MIIIGPVWVRSGTSLEFDTVGGGWYHSLTVRNVSLLCRVRVVGKLV